MASKQLSFFKNRDAAYGGDLLTTRAARAETRPISTKHTMHLVLRSTKARGDWSFWKPENKKAIAEVVSKFSKKYGIRVFSMANVGNHLHFHIKVSNRKCYEYFIRAVTGAIAMKITHKHRWDPLKISNKDRFWDRRPYTNILKGMKGFLTLRNYIEINQLEGFGLKRDRARFYLNMENAQQLDRLAFGGRLSPPDIFFLNGAP